MKAPAGTHRRVQRFAHGGVRPKKAVEHEEHASHCRELACTAASPQRRAMLIQMAEAWESLVRGRQEHVAQQARTQQPCRMKALSTKDLISRKGLRWTGSRMEQR